MRTGSVDPSRIGKRKKSPKPKPKRPHHPSQPAADASLSQPPIAETAETEEANSEPPAFEHVISERLATTPGFGKEEEEVDIPKTFEVCCFNMLIYSSLVLSNLVFHFGFPCQPHPESV